MASPSGLHGSLDRVSQGSVMGIHGGRKNSGSCFSPVAGPVGAWNTLVMVPPSSCGKPGLGDLRLRSPFLCILLCHLLQSVSAPVGPEVSPSPRCGRGAGVGGAVEQSPSTQCKSPGSWPPADSASSCLSPQVPLQVSHECGGRRDWFISGPLSVGSPLGRGLGSERTRAPVQGEPEANKAHFRAAGSLHANPRSPENGRDAEVTMETQKWPHLAFWEPIALPLDSVPMSSRSGSRRTGLVSWEFRDLTL